MNSIINSDIFDSRCEMIVLPISTDATISFSFQSGLDKNDIKLSFKKKNYTLGEIEIHRIQNRSSIKYIVLACSVEGQTSNYLSIGQLAQKIALAIKKFKSIKTIGIPLLGTGAGNLDSFKSLNTIFESFYKSAPKGIDLVFCIPDYNTFQFLRKDLITDEGVSILRIRQIIIHNLRTKTKKLDLGNCGLRNLDVIPELFKCLHLEELILSNEWGEFEGGRWNRKKSINKGIGNVLVSLPTGLKNLANLKVFICGGDWNVKTTSEKLKIKWDIKDISVVSHLINLLVLNLSNNSIEKVDKINNLVQLERLYLNNNNIIRFQDLGKLKSLKELYLSNNNLSSVSFLQNLFSIKTLDLHSNKISDLTPLKNIISKIGIVDSKWTINTISISSNPLRIPRPEVISQGKEKVLAYFNQVKAEQSINLTPFINKDIKLILVGNSNVGKSTLLYWLKNRKVKKDISSTHWLDVDKWQAKGKEHDFTVRVFDFGGQEYYHDTHHLFFTNQTAFVVLWDSQTDGYNEIEINQEQVDGNHKKVKIQSYPLSYWLDSINFHTKRKKRTDSEKEIELLLDERDKSINEAVKAGTNWTNKVTSSTEAIVKVLNGSENILVAQNKVDSIAEKLFIDQKSLKGNHERIFDFLAISVIKEKGLNIFEEMLFQIFKSLPILNKPYLGTWGFIKAKIENTEFKNAYTLVDFKDYCNNIIKEIPKVKGKAVAQINEVLFSDQDAESFAQFLNDIGVLLFFPEIEQIKDKVFVNQKSILGDIYKILFGLDNLQGEFNIKKVMDVFGKQNKDDEVADIINLMRHFKIIFEHPTKKETYIAPLYLPKEPLQSIKIFSSLFKKPSYRYKYNTFIHKNVILDFFHHYGKHALKATDSSELYYYWKDGIVLKDDSTGEIIMVKFYEPTKENQCAFVDVYSLQDSKDEIFLKKITADLEKINDGWGVVKTVSMNGEDFVPIDIILKNEKDNNWVFHYDGKVYKLTDFRKHLNKLLKMKKVFISYSKSDTVHLTKLENHLSVLKRTGIISTWNCRKLLPGEKWDGKIKKELEVADLILFLISDDFLATDYIWDVEIKRAIERDNDPSDSVRVVPIIVRSCDWEDSPLGIYNTAPKKAQVISSSDNIDEAWTKVIKELKKVL